MNHTLGESKSILVTICESSAEEHALTFLPEILKRSPDLRFFGIAGKGFSDGQIEKLYELALFSTFGITGAIKKIFFYKKVLNDLVREVVVRKAGAAILIDYQTFNLILAKRLAKLGVKILYYVAPQAWAWKAYRANQLAKIVDTLYCLLPFEPDWFKAQGVKRAIWVPHPFLFKFKLPGKLERTFPTGNSITLLLLPGSRKSEIDFLLPIFLDAINRLHRELPIYTFKCIMVMAQVVEKEYYQSHLVGFNFSIDLVENQYLEQSLLHSDVALCASGTVTLACGLFKLPTIVCYGGSPINYFIYQSFVKYQGPISLTNLYLSKRVFPELIQNQVDSYKICQHLFFFLIRENWQRCIDDLSELPRAISGTESIDVTTDVIQQIIGT